MTVSVKYASSLHIHTEEGTIEIDQWSNLDPKIYSAIGARAGLSKSSPSTCDGEGDRAMITPITHPIAHNPLPPFRHA
jgi:hypothetical protein